MRKRSESAEAAPAPPPGSGAALGSVMTIAISLQASVVILRAADFIRSYRELQGEPFPPELVLYLALAGLAGLAFLLNGACLFVAGRSGDLDQPWRQAARRLRMAAYLFLMGFAALAMVMLLEYLVILPFIFAGYLLFLYLLLYTWVRPAR